MIDKKYAVGYIRVSTEEQAGDDRYGVEAQKREILMYADAHDYTIAKWYIDHASGASDDRAEWNKILSGEEVTNPPYSAVIAFKSDRIARNMKYYFYYLYVLERRNVEMISTQEDFDGQNEFANIYRALMLFVAEQERKNIALRTSSGRTIKAAVGGYSGGRCPYGYKVTDGRLIIEPKEAEIVLKVFELGTQYENGKAKYTYQDIAEQLNDLGYRTRNGGKKFLFPTVRNILGSVELYAGYYKYGDMASYVRGAQSPILSDNLYDEYKKTPRYQQIAKFKDKQKAKKNTSED